MLTTGRRMFIILISSVMVFLVMIFSNVYKDEKIMGNTSARRGNMFFVGVINYTMPLIKVLNFDEEDMAESTFSVKDELLSSIGINIKHPENIIGKEIAFFTTNSSSSTNVNKNSSVKETFNDNSTSAFNLKNSDVKKASTTANSNNTSSNNVFNIYDKSLKKTLDTSKPEVLIYHSHTTESYSPYGPDNMDPNKDVCAVGDSIAKELQNNYGISVIHDTTIHNALAYNKSYERSGETVDKYLKKYGDFKMVIDLHRDSSDDKKALTMKINGEDVAKFMFVMARKNPHYDKNIALVNSIVDTSNKDFPGLCNGIFYYNYGMNFFNQAKSNNAFLIEVGSDVNTMDEAKNTGKYIARVIAEVLNKNKWIKNGKKVHPLAKGGIFLWKKKYA